MALIKKPKIAHIYNKKSAIKFGIIGVSLLVGLVSILYTNLLVNKLREREKKIIDLYASTLEYTANEASGENLSFLQEEIILPNNDIPVILADENKNPISHRNLSLDKNLTKKQKNNVLKNKMTVMQSYHEPIKIELKDPQDNVRGHQFIYYQNSYLLSQLQYYPYVQLSVIAALGVLAYLIFSYSKSAEQNRVWVGLAKETAHQLGTPLSSLMAWMDYFKSDQEKYDPVIVNELQKDIGRLEMITARFSNIGSKPVMNEENVYETINTTVSYLQRRVSTKVNFEIVQDGTEPIMAPLNPALFDWVIENICKNSVDAMGGQGKISIKISQVKNDRVNIDISDTGKGIPKSKISQVFSPGFTTKQRGWGLGLALVKRIIDQYHQGRIFIKETEPNVGTTFRIILYKY